MTVQQWPSREEWARQRRTFYCDQLPDISTSLADYATPAEIRALAAAMRALWQELGREMRRKGNRREELQSARQTVNRGLKLIRRGELPLALEDYQGAEDILADLHTRYEAAKVEACERRAREIAQAAIDDGAWDAELERRAKVDRYLKR
jgi:hypothetical protein